MSSKTLEDGYLRLGAALEWAAAELPPMFWIQLEIEKGSGVCSLYERNDLQARPRKITYPSNHESFADEISDAVEHAKRLATIFKSPG